MPELPEVETVRLQLLSKIVGKKITQVEVFHIKTVAGDKKFASKLKGKVLSDISRVGKLLIFKFNSETGLFMLAHLKMTGQFFYIEKDGNLSGGGHSMIARDVEKFPGRHTRTSFTFADGSALYFNDMRLFGYTKLSDQRGMEKAKEKFGPEPIAKDFDCEWFTKALQKKNRVIKSVLLDQSFVSGLGNIYVDEVLWYAKIKPTRKANKINAKKAAQLCRAMKDVLFSAIKARGTTFMNFKDSDGEAGNYRQHLKVFGREGKLCKRCKTIIKKIRVAGRGTHYCPKCQRN